MPLGEMVGWLAAGLTLLAFSLRSIFALRLAAMAANVCFIVYAALTGLYPVLALHMLLLPCNLVRLRQLSSMAEATRQTIRLPDVTAAPARQHVPFQVALGGDRDWLIVCREYRRCPPSPAAAPAIRHLRTIRQLRTSAARGSLSPAA